MKSSTLPLLKKGEAVRKFPLWSIFLAIFLPIYPIRAQMADFIDATSILTITDEIPKAELARDVQWGGYELANGGYQTFEYWYRRKYPSLYFEAQTLIRPDLALNWGISTGEIGEKYKIAPAVKLGLQYLIPFNENSDLVLSGYRFFGGSFKEKLCLADYGEVGELQKVNCRLAATELAPEDTLDYLIRDFSQGWGVSFEFQIRF